MVSGSGGEKKVGEFGGVVGIGISDPASLNCFIQIFNFQKMRDFIGELISTQQSGLERTAHSPFCNCHKCCGELQNEENEFLDSIFNYFKPQKDLLSNQQVKDAIKYNNKNNGSWTRYYDDIIKRVLKLNYSPDEADFAQAVARWQTDNGYSGKNIDGKLGPGTWGKMQKILGLKFDELSPIETPVPFCKASKNRKLLAC